MFAARHERKSAANSTFSAIVVCVILSKNTRLRSIIFYVRIIKKPAMTLAGFSLIIDRDYYFGNDLLITQSHLFHRAFTVITLYVVAFVFLFEDLFIQLVYCEINRGIQVFLCIFGIKVLTV